MRDAATRARTREKHNALKRLKNQVDKPTPTAKTEGVRHPTGVRPLLHISTTTDNMLHLKVRAGMVHRNCDRPALNTVSQSRQIRGIRRPDTNLAVRFTILNRPTHDRTPLRWFDGP